MKLSGVFESLKCIAVLKTIFQCPYIIQQYFNLIWNNNLE
jgi:hypothetical protein